MKFYSSTILALFLSLNSLAAEVRSLVEYTGEPKQLSASGVSVNIYPGAKVGEAQNVVRNAGSGLRWKMVTIIKTNIYVASHYVDEAAHFGTEDPIETVKNVNDKVMQLTFVRALTAKDIRNAMETSLRNNKVAVDSPLFQDIFNQFDFNTKPGDTMTIVGEKQEDGTEKLTIEFANDHRMPAKVITGQAAGLATDFWKGWLGYVDFDAGLKELKPKLISIQ